MGLCLFCLLLQFFTINSAPATIPWDQNGDNQDSQEWSLQFQDSISTLAARLRWKCKEPRNLPELFMSWFRESQSDPTMLTFMSDITAHSHGSNGSRMSQLRMKDPATCRHSPSDAQASDLMERALCPWEWRINREENREPKLISEARCLCRFARGGSGAQCMPIRREFPVLKRVYCDQRKGSSEFEYVRAFQTVTVGCHSVMPRTARAVPLSHHFRKIRRHHRNRK